MSRARSIAFQAGAVIPANCFGVYVLWTSPYPWLVVLPGVAIALTVGRLLAVVAGDIR